VAREGKPCKWSGILAHQLKEQVTKARQSPMDLHADIYMSTYILDAVCARHEFPALEWAWSPAETVVNTYFKLLSKCIFKGAITQLSDHFVIPVYKMIFKQDPPYILKEAMEALQIGMPHHLTLSSKCSVRISLGMFFQSWPWMYLSCRK